MENSEKILPDWAKAMNCAVTVCDADCNIIYMVIKKILNLEPLKQEVIQSVSTQFRASPFERALFSALN